MKLDMSNSQESAERARAHRWTASGKCRVEHPKYGSVIVPCCSKLGAILNAAELWGVDWLALGCASVVAVEPDEMRGLAAILDRRGGAKSEDRADRR